MPRIPRPTDDPPYPSGSWEYLKHITKDQSNRLPTLANGSTCNLNIAIIGAGVGGLAAAIALKRHGHIVSIYENAPALSEIGAGIQIPPNSVRIMHSWGLEKALKKKSVEPKSLLWKRWQDGEIIGHTRYQPDFHRRFGAPYYVTHRAHLHEVLHEKAVELGIPVHLGSSVVRYSLDEASFQLQSGEQVTTDLVVAADGIKSTARQTILGCRERPLRNHDIAAYRATVPIRALKERPHLASNVDFGSLNLWVGDQTHVMSYSIAGGESFNMVITIPEPGDPDEWDSEDSFSVEKMQSYFVGWDPVLTEILSMVTKTSKWPVRDIDFCETWSSPSKRLVLLGDSAHSMIPFMSIGAAMAVEDAQALAESLSFVTDKAQLSRAVAVYEETRKARVRLMHEASYRHAYTVHLQDGPEQRARDEAMADEVAGVHFIQSPNQWSDPSTQRWAYDHDVAASIQQAWYESRSKQDSAEKSKM